jgi:RNA polymerase sigma factor (TIGR02999 family)
MADLIPLPGDGQPAVPYSAEELLPLVYDALRRLAAHRMAHEAPGQTLDATGLVHEAYLRLAGGDDPARWKDRAHFFGAAAEAMRRILVDIARRKRTRKHGGGMERHALADDFLAAFEPREDVLALDEALDRLAAEEPTAAELVKLRYFAGLTVAEAAEVLAISPRTADRHWAYARAWLHQEMKAGGHDGPPG